MVYMKELPNSPSGLALLFPALGPKALKNFALTGVKKRRLFEDPLDRSSYALARQSKILAVALAGDRRARLDGRC